MWAREEPAGGADEARFASFSPSGRLVLLANELAQGSELDADGACSPRFSIAAGGPRPARKSAATRGLRPGTALAFAR